MALRKPLLVALLLGASTGCVILNTVVGVDSYAFGHRLHVEEEGLDCIDCHIYAEDEADPGMPRLRQCDLCHDELDAELPEHKRMASFFDGRDYLRTHPEGFPDEVIFDHLAHVEAMDYECLDCHADVADNDLPGYLDPQKMDACVACHDGQGRQDDCTVCHADLDVDVAPRTHDLGWGRMHGEIQRSCAAETVNDCAMCHTEQTCNACHQVEQPASHDVYFARRGHGLHARMDRDSCSTCHTPDSCDQCHSVSAPITHVGGFGGTMANHCVGCHVPVQGETCFTCHKGTPSHFLATPLPPGHNPGMNCRQCHGLDAPLPHPDKGDSCIACHM